ncbi:MAG TPA: M1 family peptidase, partial [Candidatus Marinimicrobia bacterium]|nr:M1 family peptidase [Candidatus Neomarinimicrobiota bacterium]
MKKSFLLLFCSYFFVGQLNADNYPKNPDIDILHYRFELILSDDEDIIRGSATLYILFKVKGLKKIRLDLVNKDDTSEGKGMEVSKVTLNGRTQKYVHRENVLTIVLDQPSRVNQVISLTIDYYGVPASGLKIAPNKYGDRTFFSDNWPNRARHWLPTIDHPYEKATSEMIVIAPNHYQVISNGLLVEESNLNDGLKRTHWKQAV